MEENNLQEISNSEALKLLRNQWPEVFKISEPKPLKVGIHKDIMETHLFSKEIVNKALKFFTSQEKYLARMKPNKNRIDLECKPSGKVKLKDAVNSEILLYTRSKPKQRIYMGQLKLISLSDQDTSDNQTEKETIENKREHSSTE